MHRLMGVIRDRNGTYYAQQRVPERLQEAVARVLGGKKSRQVFLKRSLGTKVLREANIRAKPVLMDFDRILKRAAELEAAKPVVRTGLSAAEIRRVAEHHFASVLHEDDQHRRYGFTVLSDKARDFTDRVGMNTTTQEDVAVGEI